LSSITGISLAFIDFVFDAWLKESLRQNHRGFELRSNLFSLRLF
jgi:hypothetical protein